MLKPYRSESVTQMNRSNCYTLIFRDVMFCNDIRNSCERLCSRRFSLYTSFSCVFSLEQQQFSHTPSNVFFFVLNYKQSGSICLSTNKNVKHFIYKRNQICVYIYIYIQYIQCICINNRLATHAG